MSNKLVLDFTTGHKAKFGTTNDIGTINDTRTTATPLVLWILLLEISRGVAVVYNARAK